MGQGRGDGHLGGLATAAGVAVDLHEYAITQGLCLRPDAPLGATVRCWGWPE